MRVVDIDGNAKEIDIFFEKIATKGRPKKILTEDACKLIANMASVMCTEEEIAICLGATTDTLHNAENDELFRNAIEKGRANGKKSLRRKQWDIAMKGNASMLIWLGKQWLGQTDKLEAKVQDDNRTEMRDFLEAVKSGKLTKGKDK